MIISTPALYNAQQLTRLIRSLQLAFGLITLILVSLLLFFAYRWQQALHQDVAYFVSPAGTHAAYKRDTKPVRAPLELEHFVHTFLQHAFAHNEFTYKANLSAALLVMERKSGLFLKSQFTEEALEEIYHLHNGVSTLEVEQVTMNLKDYPYEVAAYYQTTLHFVGSGEEQHAQSGVYFRLSQVPRSPENPYGLLISDFQFIAYKHDDTP
ncbi:MAG: hypothetical protein AAFQ08_03110 [Bacteroidota bacterium]